MLLNFNARMVQKWPIRQTTFHEIHNALSFAFPCITVKILNAVLQNDSCMCNALK